MKVKLPPPVQAIYKAVEELTALYPGRKFTPDGHLVGSIGEVIAAEALGLTLYPSSNPAHDARDRDGRDVQIKMTAGASIAMYAECDRLVVLKVISPEFAEIVYDGPGAPAWEAAGRMQKNGQRPISLSRLAAIRRGLEDAAADLAATGGNKAAATRDRRIGVRLVSGLTPSAEEAQAAKAALVEYVRTLARIDARRDAIEAGEASAEDLPPRKPTI